MSGLHDNSELQRCLKYISTIFKTCERLHVNTLWIAMSYLAIFKAF